jgi:hypothetical protein
MYAGELVVVGVSCDDGGGGSNKIQTPTSIYVDRFRTITGGGAGGLWSTLYYGICTTGAGIGTIICDLSGAPANYGCAAVVVASAPTPIRLCPAGLLPGGREEAFQTGGSYTSMASGNGIGGEAKGELLVCYAAAPNATTWSPGEWEMWRHFWYPSIAAQQSTNGSCAIECVIEDDPAFYRGRFYTGRMSSSVAQPRYSCLFARFNEPGNVVLTKPTWL